MSDSNVWEYFREPYEHEMPRGEKVTFYRDGIRRNDGFTLIKRFRGMSNGDFICRGDFGEFWFTSKLEDGTASGVLGKCTVYPEKFEPKWPGEEKRNRELCLAHLKDIEDGLLHFPTIYYFDYIPEEPYSIFKEDSLQSPLTSEVSGLTKTIKSIFRRFGIS